MNILKEEINQSNCDVISLAKWKLAVVSAVIVVSLGWIDTLVNGQYLVRLG